MAETSQITIKSVVTTVYGDLTGANAYLAASINGTAWAALTTGVKSQRMIEATRLFERTGWAGTPTATISKTLPQPANTQPLQWPRTGLTDRNTVALASDAIPEDVISAIYELANMLTSTSTLLTSETSAGQKKATTTRTKVGPIDVTDEIEFFGSIQENGSRFGTQIDELIGLWLSASSFATFVGGLVFEKPFDVASGCWGFTGEGLT